MLSNAHSQCSTSCMLCGISPGQIFTVSIAISTDEKVKGKGPVESEGFMNALSSQAAKMKEKKRKISKVS